MKTTFLLPSSLLATALLFSACSNKEPATTVAQDATAVAKDTKEIAANSWDAIKDYTFEQRDDFAAGFDHMMTSRNSGMAMMNTAHMGMSDATAKTRDAAVKEFHAASAVCAEQMIAVRASTAETWAATKVTADAAWQRMQKAYGELSPPTAS